MRVVEDETRNVRDPVRRGSLGRRQNALAGGGSFVTIPALMFVGLDAKAANITSTVALYTGQLATGFAGRGLVADAEGLSFRVMCGIGAAGGAIGALILIATSSATFEALLPWLVLFATLVFAVSAFGRGARRDAARSRAMPEGVGLVVQMAISIYGGYFGGGIGFVLVAALSLFGMVSRAATATKNALAAAINTTSVLVFLFSPALIRLAALVVAGGAIGGGLLGAWLLRRVPEHTLKVIVVVIGAALTAGLFARR